MAERIGLGQGPEAIDTFFDRTRPWERSERELRDYEAAPPHVKDFYQQNHQHQTVKFVRDTQARYSDRASRTLVAPMFDMMMEAGKLRDASDPDNPHEQIIHGLQGAEAVRRNRGKEWMRLTGLLHDVGKLLGTDILLSDTRNPRPPLPQWAVVGDTFPVGCAHSDSIVFPEYFRDGPNGEWEGNPDAQNPELNTPHGIYTPNTGLDNLTISFSHDGYLADVVDEVDTIPPAAKWMIRYHSLYPVHWAGAYRHLLRPEDMKVISAARGFNVYDLYSKDDPVPDKAEQTRLLNEYKPLVEKYFPTPLNW